MDFRLIKITQFRFDPGLGDFFIPGVETPCCCLKG